nr:hypothetical protein [Tanacetum cinerariifolium]
MESQLLVASVKARYTVEFVHFTLRELEIHSLMIQLRILSMILKIFPTTIHNPSTRLILDSFFNQDFDNNFPQTSPSFPQQYLCCENCGGPHETFQCQPMNQNFYNSSSFGFDQFQPSQYPVIHHPPQETSVEMLQAREYLMESIQTFLKEFDCIPFGEKPMALLLAHERFSEIKQAFREEQHQPEIVQELLCKLLNDFVKNLVRFLSESEGITDDTCDVPFCDNSPPLDILNDHFEIFSDSNDDCTSSDDDSFENIDYVEASPLDYKLIGLEEVKEDILREKLLNINLLIANIESLNDNSTPDCVLKSPSPFPIPVEDSDSFFENTTTHADNSLPEYDSFLFKIEPGQGELTSVVMEDILGEPYVHVPNVLPTHPTLMLDSDFIYSDDSLGSDLEVSFLSGTRNKIFNPGIFFEVQSKRFISPDTFFISFIRNLLFPLRETLLPFSSENEDKVFNPGILSSNLLSHQGKITFNFSESSMMISGGDIPFLDVMFLYFYPP